MSTATRPRDWRPPSKEEINDFLERFDEATLRGNSTWTQEEMALMVRAYRYQEGVLQGLQEDIRDAGREVREITNELRIARADIEGGW